MKIIEISLTKKQVRQLEDGRFGMDTFALLAHPVISSQSMKVAVMNNREANKFSRVWTRFKKSIGHNHNERGRG